MINFLRLPGFAILSVLLLSCESDIRMNDLIDRNASLTLTILHLNEKVAEAEAMEIKVDSKKHKQFMDWMDENTSGWITTPATFVTDVIITQSNFRLQYDPKGYVVLSFYDRETDAEQIS